VAFFAAFVSLYDLYPRIEFTTIVYRTNLMTIQPQSIPQRVPYSLKRGEGWTYRYGIPFTLKAGELNPGRGAAFTEYQTQKGE